AMVDESQGNYDYPAAFKEIENVRQFYPDSAQVQSLQTDLNNRRNTLISQLNSTFDEYLANDSRLLPLENEEDITDVLARLRQAAPDNALLDDARLSTRYAELAELAVSESDWNRASDYLKAGLEYASADALLLNLDDQVSRELKRQADAKLVADIKERLNSQRGAMTSVEGYAAAVEDLSRLSELRPDDALLERIVTPLRATVGSRITELSVSGEFARAEEILFTFARLFPVSSLLTMRDMLSKAEIGAGFQPANLSEALNALNQRRVRMDELLAKPAFDNAWNEALAKEFKESIALLRPGNVWFEDMQQKIVNAYVKQATALIETDRFDAARRSLDTGENFGPASSLFEGQRTALATAEAQFKREQEERLRVARIDALRNSLVTQANANEVATATRTLETLRKELPENDLFVTTTGPTAIAEAYLRLANTQAERGSFSNAMSFAREGLKLAPDLQGLKDAAAEFGNQARRQELMELANGATTGNIRQLPSMMSEVQKLFPSDATAIASDAIRNLATRIRNLESSDVVAANDLLAVAKQLFPSDRTLEGISLRQPPRPSQYVPGGREAMNKNQLTAADKILATAQRAEPGHEQVAAFARELGERKEQANKYFVYYQQLMRQGQKSQAKPYLDQSLKLWSDNEQYQKELANNFTTTRAPTRSADGSRACTASLAGYGRSGRAVCYDMVAENVRGPELIVVPAGTGFAQPFAIGKFEVSVGELNTFCSATGKCKASTSNPELPATGVSYQEMQAYVQWLGETTGTNYRIPSEAEWIYASNAGNPAAVKDFNCRVTQGGQIIKGLTMLETKSGRSNPWGLTNYVGNAQEIVRTPAGISARGGAFQDNLSACDIQFVRNHSGAADDVTGFRVARDAD
ncbi:MAG: formylglycine-generating enzyme family protein, partial [Proteobacteria bacterium]|nr:formylglycine-generating enzyme family protein [Pseudomonadota bacterium]